MCSTAGIAAFPPPQAPPAGPVGAGGGQPSGPTLYWHTAMLAVATKSSGKKGDSIDELRRRHGRVGAPPRLVDALHRGRGL